MNGRSSVTKRYPVPSRSRSRYPKLTATPIFSQFHSGTPVTLPSGEAVLYGELREAGLQEFYIRIVHQSALQGEVTRSQVDDWLRRAASKDRHTGRATRRGSCRRASRTPTFGVSGGSGAGVIREMEKPLQCQTLKSHAKGVGETIPTRFRKLYSRFIPVLLYDPSPL